jgi:two-component system, NarL family, nitrate/nitrite response regulator NarL
VSTAAVRCLVADDHPGLIAAVSDYLGRSGFEVFGHAGDGVASLARIRELRPEIAVVDYRP